MQTLTAIAECHYCGQEYEADDKPALRSELTHLGWLRVSPAEHAAPGGWDCSAKGTVWVCAHCRTSYDRIRRARQGPRSYDPGGWGLYWTQIRDQLNRERYLAECAARDEAHRRKAQRTTETPPRVLEMQARRNEGWTLERIARENCITRERVHQLLKRWS